jgi:hypothetical protein
MEVRAPKKLMRRIPAVRRLARGDAIVLDLIGDLSLMPRI